MPLVDGKGFNLQDIVDGLRDEEGGSTAAIYRVKSVYTFEVAGYAYGCCKWGGVILDVV